MEQPRFDEIINEIMYLYQSYGNVQRIYVDASARAVVCELKASYFNEPPEWVEDFKRLKQIGIDPNKVYTVIPVNFSTEHRSMLWHVKRLLDNEQLAIPSECDRLITSLMTASAYDGSLEKDKTSFHDSLDSLRLSLKEYIFAPSPPNIPSL